MRISDWSSDVCSSDLGDCHTLSAPLGRRPGRHCATRSLGQQHGRRSLSKAAASLPFRGPERRRPDRYPPSRERWPTLARRSEEHTSELQSLMRISYAVFCLKKKKAHKQPKPNTQSEYSSK